MVLIMTTQARRNLSVLRNGSPNFVHTFGIILAGENEYVEIASRFPRARKYAPLRNLVVTNDAGEAVDLEINGRFFAVIPAGTIVTVEEAIWSIRLTNNDAAATDVAANEIRANLSTPAMTADLAARLGLPAGE